jgi:hypothetical protein
MIDIQVLDTSVLNKITHRRFTQYLSSRGWYKHDDNGEIEQWAREGLAQRIIVLPSSNYPHYLEVMRSNLELLASVFQQAQVFIVAAILGTVKVTTDGDNVICWKEWYIDNEGAEMKIVLYKDVDFLPYEDGDKVIDGIQIDMATI